MGNVLHHRVRATFGFEIFDLLFVRIAPCRNLEKTHTERVRVDVFAVALAQEELRLRVC